MAPPAEVGVSLGLWLLACFQPPGPPCADGGWGAISSPEQAAHVRADGDDAGDGSQEDPFASLEAALATGPAAIAIGPGTFETALDVVDVNSGLAIEGCSAEETELAPAIEGEPQLKFTGATGVTVTGLALVGGDRPLWVWAAAEVVAEGVHIDEARWSGFLVDGPYTLLDLLDLEVRGTTSVGGVGGYGGEIDGATVHWVGGGAWGNTAAGVVASGDTALLELDEVEVADTLPADDGAFGRGVQVQGFGRAALTDVTLARNADAGFFSLLGEEVTLERVIVEQVTAGAEGGDGIVVTGVDAAGAQLDPAIFSAILVDTTVADVDRAGVVLERVTADLTGTAVSGTTPEQAVVAQEGAVVTGDAAVVPAAPLTLNRAELAATDAR